MVTLGGKPLVQVARKESLYAPCAASDCVAVRPVVATSTCRARSVASGQCDCVVEEEQWRPTPRSSERPPPIAKFEFAHDPERTSMMPHDVLELVDDASSIPGEHATAVGREEISERIDPVPSRHIFTVTDHLASVYSDMRDACRPGRPIWQRPGGVAGR